MYFGAAHLTNSLTDQELSLYAVIVLRLNNLLYLPLQLIDSFTEEVATTMSSMRTLTSKGGTGHWQQSTCLRRPTISFWRGFALLFGFFTIVNSQDTREIGVDICFCAPSSYEFTLDFSLFCPPVNITLGDAVKRTSCAVNPFGSPDVSDLVPVAVSSIEILELDQGMQVSVREKIEGSFGDGDTFQYSSYAALPGEIVNPDDLPRAIQLNIVGVNQFDESLINIYLIIFTNNCGRYPVLFEGQSAGWTRFVSAEKYISRVSV